MAADLKEPSEVRESEEYWTSMFLFMSLICIGLHFFCAYYPYTEWTTRVTMYIPEIDPIMPTCLMTSIILDGVNGLLVFILFWLFKFNGIPLVHLFRFKFWMYAAFICSTVTLSFWMSSYLILEPITRKCGKGYQEFSCRSSIYLNKMERVNCHIPLDEATGLTTDGYDPQYILRDKTKTPFEHYDCYYIDSRDTWTKFTGPISYKSGNTCSSWTWTAHSKCLCEPLPEDFQKDAGPSETDPLTGDVSSITQYQNFASKRPDEQIMNCDYLIPPLWPWLSLPASVFHGHYLWIGLILQLWFFYFPGWIMMDIIPAVTNQVFVKLILYPLLYELAGIFFFTYGYIQPMFQQTEYDETFRWILFGLMIFWFSLTGIKFLWLVYFYTIYWEMQYGDHPIYGSLYSDRLQAASLESWEIAVFLFQICPIIGLSTYILMDSGFPDESNYYNGVLSLKHVDPNKSGQQDTLQTRQNAANLTKLRRKQEAGIPLIVEQILVALSAVTMIFRFLSFLLYKWAQRYEDKITGVAKYKGKTAPSSISGGSNNYSQSGNYVNDLNSDTRSVMSGKKSQTSSHPPSPIKLLGGYISDTASSIGNRSIVGDGGPGNLNPSEVLAQRQYQERQLMLCDVAEAPPRDDRWQRRKMMMGGDHGKNQVYETKIKIKRMPKHMIEQDRNFSMTKETGGSDKKVTWG